jgi:hypothetical protein
VFEIQRPNSAHERYFYIFYITGLTEEPFCLYMNFTKIYICFCFLWYQREKETND